MSNLLGDSDTFNGTDDYEFVFFVTVRSWAVLIGQGYTIARVHDDVVNSLASLGNVNAATLNAIQNSILDDMISGRVNLSFSQPTPASSAEAKILYGCNFLAQNNGGTPTTPFLQPHASTLSYTTDVIDRDSIVIVNGTPPTTVLPPPSAPNMIDAATSALSNVQSTDPTQNNHTVAGNTAGAVAAQVADKTGLTQNISQITTIIEIVGVVVLAIAALVAIGYVLRPVATLTKG